MKVHPEKWHAYWEHASTKINVDLAGTPLSLHNIVNVTYTKKTGEALTLFIPPYSCKTTTTVDSSRPGYEGQPCSFPFGTIVRKRGSMNVKV